MIPDTLDKKICHAIKVIAESIIAKAGYNKTVVATVINISGRKDCQYKLQYQDATIYAYSITPDIRYDIGDRVYVLFLNNDENNDKIILSIVRR